MKYAKTKNVLRKISLAVRIK